MGLPAHFPDNTLEGFGLGGGSTIDTQLQRYQNTRPVLCCGLFPD